MVDEMLKSFALRGQEYLQHKLDKKDKQEYTALHYAVRYGHYSVAQLLIAAGAGMCYLGGFYAWQPIIMTDIICRDICLTPLPTSELLSVSLLYQDLAKKASSYLYDNNIYD